MMQRELVLSRIAWHSVTDILAEYALHNHLTPFISMQNYHNALYRDVSLVLL